ncbi:MAG: hypothetical protein GY869_25495 [Planctomycetes bacterium]|nr:hypothetical protein [Planctomycetota bacterium]
MEKNRPTREEAEKNKWKKRLSTTIASVGALAAAVLVTLPFIKRGKKKK